MGVLALAGRVRVVGRHGGRAVPAADRALQAGGGSRLLGGGRRCRRRRCFGCGPRPPREPPPPGHVAAQPVQEQLDAAGQILLPGGVGHFGHHVVVDPLERAPEPRVEQQHGRVRLLQQALAVVALVGGHDEVSEHVAAERLAVGVGHHVRPARHVAHDEPDPLAAAADVDELVRADALRRIARVDELAQRVARAQPRLARLRRPDDQDLQLLGAAQRRRRRRRRWRLSGDGVGAISLTVRHRGGGSTTVVSLLHLPAPWAGSV